MNHGKKYEFSEQEHQCKQFSEQCAEYAFPEQLFPEQLFSEQQLSEQQLSEQQFSEQQLSEQHPEQIQQQERKQL